MNAKKLHKIIENIEYKHCSKCNEYIPIENFHKSTTWDGLNRYCKTCTSMLAKERYIKYRERILKRNNDYKQNNTELTKLRHKKYKDKNREKIKIQNREYARNRRKLDPDRFRNEVAEYRRKYPERVKDTQAKYCKNHPAKIAAKNGKRRASKINATPKWLNTTQLKQIESYYVEARRLTLESGIIYTVDHIIPLRGKTVSGLHVPWNLQILTKSENSKKQNFINYNYPDESKNEEFYQPIEYITHL